MILNESSSNNGWKRKNYKGFVICELSEDIPGLPTIYEEHIEKNGKKYKIPQFYHDGKVLIDAILRNEISIDDLIEIRK